MGSKEISVALYKPSRMKKVFLLFGVASFCSASAQQKDVFDINKHLGQLLNKKNTALPIINSHNAIRFYVAGVPGTGLQSSPVLPDGNKVYTLPIDKTPCVIPGMKQFNMPNVSNPNEYFESLVQQHLPGTIPNAVNPYRLNASE